VRLENIRVASIQRVKNSPNYTIRFRFQGRNVHRSLGTGDRRKATGICLRIEETIRLLESGRIEVPAGTGPIEFIFADGKKTEKPIKANSLGLTDFYITYAEKLPEGRKEASTLHGERIHLKHLKRHLGPNRKIQSITKADLQNYVSYRLKEKHHSKPIQPDTVRKELVTFRMLWNWAFKKDCSPALLQPSTWCCL